MGLERLLDAQGRLDQLMSDWDLFGVKGKGLERSVKAV